MRSPCTATKSSPRSPQLEKACVQQQRPNAAKNKYIKLINFQKKVFKNKQTKNNTFALDFKEEYFWSK